MRSPALILLAAVHAAGAQIAPITATRVASIGCEGCGDAREINEVTDLILLDSGRVLVTDHAAPMVRIFSRDGRVVSTFGRSGRGPGEFGFPVRAALLSDRSLRVYDMNLRRITHFSPTMDVLGTTPMGSFVAASAARHGSGELVLMTDNFRGTHTLERWTAGADKGVVIASFNTPTPSDGVVGFPSIAVAPDGEIAVAPSGNEYRITRYSPAGAPLSGITRDIPRTRRTPEEEAELQRRMAASRGRLSAERGAGAGRGSRPAIGNDPNNLSLKPHFPIGALQYDSEGRLWILTARGTGDQSIFDLFARNGAYLGAFTLPARVARFTVTGDELVTASQSPDGVPMVEIWRLGRR
jgi:hypothetical protein